MYQHYLVMLILYLLTSVGPAVGEKYVKRCCTVTNLKDDEDKLA